MELKPKRPSRLWSRLHFLTRVLGLTGLLAAGLGLLLGLTTDLHDVNQIVAALSQSGLPAVVAWLLVAGAGAVLVSLLVEVGVVLRVVAGRRSLVGGNAVLQIVLAGVLLVGINIFSFGHYLRFDWTRPDPKTGAGKFTLPETIRDQLRKFKQPMTIVVCQRHRSAGQLGDTHDAYDAAAERKVVEKVKDTVELFRELGPQFRVVVLDVQNELFDLDLKDLLDDLNRQLKQSRKQQGVGSGDLEPELVEFRSAIEAMPENGIFFYTDGRYQRMSFDDFYALDKTASLGKSVIVLLEKKPAERRQALAQAAAVQGLAPTAGVGPLFPQALAAVGIAATPQDKPPASLANVRKRIARLIDSGAGVGPDYQVLVLREESAEGTGPKQTAEQAAAVQGLAPTAGAGPLFPQVLAAVGAAALSRNESYDPTRDRSQVLAAAPELAHYLDAATENTVFISRNGTVTQMPFAKFADMTYRSAYDALKPAGNLVLLYQGVEPFARKVLNIDEKRPRVALAVIHEVLSTEGNEELGMAGVRKTLVSRGVDVRDVILKKWGDAAPEPAVLTFDENKLEQVEEMIADLEAAIKSRDEDLETLNKYLKQWKEAKTDEELQALAKSPVARQLGVERVTDKIRKQVVERILEPNVGLRQISNEQDRKDLDSLKKERAGLKKVEEDLAERRRNTDLYAKTSRVLADCDLLILPRMTLFNAARGERISPSLYRLDPAQAEAIKDFLRSGKSLLACLGPTNDAPGRFDPDSGPDDVERLLGRLGVKLSRQTVLFNVESKAFAQRRSGLLIAGANNVEVPPLRLDWKPGEGKPRLVTPEEAGKPNPLLESLRLTAHSLGKGRNLDLRLRNPRPVYYEPGPSRLAPVTGALAAAPGMGGPAALPWQGLFFLSRFKPRPEVGPEFLLTDAESWNESQPFPTRERTPRYEPPKPDESAGDPFERKRLGPFPVGVAAEVTDWYSLKGNQPVTFRVAVIGHGGVFMGPTLSPGKEKVLLDVSNWLLGRDDMLTHETAVWEYPRVALDEQQQSLWHWGTQLGLPLLFAYLGFVVLLMRQMR
jgi:hypothetical protein